MKQIFSNLKTVLTSWQAMLVGAIVGGLLTRMIYYFSNFLLMKGNYGEVYAYSIVTLDVISVILTVIFVAATARKRMNFGKKATSNSRGIVGSFFSALVSGCPSCSITLATYLGLSSILTLLPGKGIEVKILGVLILLYVCHKSLKDLLVCDYKKKPKK